MGNIIKRLQNFITYSFYTFTSKVPPNILRGKIKRLYLFYFFEENLILEKAEA